MILFDSRLYKRRVCEYGARSSFHSTALTRCLPRSLLEQLISINTLYAHFLPVCCTYRAEPTTTNIVKDDKRREMSVKRSMIGEMEYPWSAENKLTHIWMERRMERDARFKLMCGKTWRASVNWILRYEKMAIERDLCIRRKQWRVTNKWRKMCVHSAHARRSFVCYLIFRGIFNENWNWSNLILRVEKNEVFTVNVFSSHSIIYGSLLHINGECASKN